jgi:MraZ protein
VFRGVYEHQIDGKGRTSLPAKLRETLVAAYDERLIVTTALDACLHAYPVREWELLEGAGRPEPDGDRGSRP